MVVDAPGSGGSGGGVSVTSTGVGQVSVVSSSTGGPSLCAQACAAIQAKGCGDAKCVADCQQSYVDAGPCTSLLDAVALCYITSTNPDCTNPVECQGAVQKYAACIQPGTCGNQDCSGSSDGTCDCKGSCNGSTLQVQCTPGNATDFCVCIKDGTPIGKCTEPQTNGTSCDLVNGCCGSMFFP